MWTSDEAPTELLISEEMEREREMIIDIKRQHCPDLYDAWLQPSHAWTYVQADKVWVPRIRIVGHDGCGAIRSEPALDIVACTKA